MAELARQKRREEERAREAVAQAAATEEAAKAHKLLDDARQRREEWVEVVTAVHANDEVMALARLAAVKDPKSALSASVGPGGATLLHLAVSRGFVDLMEKVLTLEPEAVRFPDEGGQTAFHRAAAVDSDGDIIELLAEYAVVDDLDRQDGHERTPLDIAQQWGFSEAADTLRDVRKRLVPPREAAPLEGEDRATAISVVAKFPGFGSQAGFTAISEGRFDDVLGLIAEPMWVFVNNVDDKKKTLLHHAATKGCEDLCEALLARSDFKTANDTDCHRSTALHMAVVCQKAECCRVIIEHPKFTAVNAVDFRSRTALHLAAMHGNEEIYQTISAHPNCSAALPDFEGRCAAEIAQSRGMDVDLPEIITATADLEM